MNTGVEKRELCAAARVKLTVPRTLNAKAGAVAIAMAARHIWRRPGAVLALQQDIYDSLRSRPWRRLAPPVAHLPAGRKIGRIAPPSFTQH